MIEVSSTEGFDAFGGVRCDACPGNPAVFEISMHYARGEREHVSRVCLSCAAELREALRAVT